LNCESCRAYSLGEQAGAVLDNNVQLAAALYHRADVLCFNLRSVNCCPVNKRSGQFMLHTSELAPVPWPVFTMPIPAAITHQVGVSE